MNIRLDHATVEELSEFAYVLGSEFLEVCELIVLDAERPGLATVLDDVVHGSVDGLVEKSVANEVDEMVGVHPGTILLEEIGVMDDKRHHTVDLLLRRMEAALAVGRDNELVTRDTSAVATDPHIRRPEQSVTTVEVVTGVTEHVLNVDALAEVVVCQWHIHLLLMVYRLNPPMSRALIPAWSPASKARSAMSCGESTPGLT